MIKLCILLHVLRNLANSYVVTLLIIVDVGLHLKEIDDTLELVFLTDR